MLLFSRMVTLRGNPRDTTPYVQDICDLVSERSPFDVSLWQGLLGMPVGSFAFSALVESRAALLAGMAQLEADDDYFDLLDRGQEYYVMPAEDRLVTIMHNAGGELQRADVGSVAEITAAQVEVDRSAEAIGWSIGMADLVAQISGVPTHLGTVEHGPFGELQWTSTVRDITEVDRIAELLGKDEDYLARLGDAKGLFVPASGRQLLAVRIR